MFHRIMSSLHRSRSKLAGTKSAHSANRAVARTRKMLIGAYESVEKTVERKTRKVPQRRKIGQVLHWLTQPFRSRVFWIVVLLLFISGGVTVGILIRDLPSPRNLTSQDRFAVSSQIFDRNGVLLYEIFADENRIPILLEDLPPHVAQASIAIEDQNFYKHFGIDFRGVVRALVGNLRGDRLEGGSTITQQLVKNALLTNERSWQRKLKEAVLAILTESIYSKDQILEMYLNYISYGGTSVGVESAAKTYFGKSAKDLTIAEAALLAGLPQAPSRYSPFGSSPERAKERQLEVLRRMEEEGFITKLQREQSAGEQLNFALKSSDIKAPHFVFYVRDFLYEKYGVAMVEKGGLRVTTTLDLALQETAQASLSAQLAKLEGYNVGNGAALILKPNTGEILSMIGSRDYFDSSRDGQVNVTLALRQPGSSIKPIMYATAFQQKLLNPGTMLIDQPTCFAIPSQKPYCPKNYDGSFRGAVTVRNSLGNSLNIPAVKGLKLVGLTTFIDQATKMGITTWTDPSRYGLSLTLGGGEVRMIDLAQAFAVLANEGVKVPLSPILKITDYRDSTLFELHSDQRLENLTYLNEYGDMVKGDLTRVMDRAPAYLASHIMQDNKARMSAFGPSSKLVIPNQIVSAKTGTTNDVKDNWTVGFTPEYLVMTWVGNNDGSSMNQRLVSGITGAAPIFNDIMRFVLAGKEPVWQEKPPDVLSAQVCETGFPKQDGQNCTVRDTELYWQYGQPSRSQWVKENVWIDPTTGLPPKFGEVIEGLVLEERTLLQDPVTENYCLDCSRPVNEEGRVQYEQYVVTDTIEDNYSETSTGSN
jgi:penicillin-binding protein 1C